MSKYVILIQHLKVGGLCRWPRDWLMARPRGPTLPRSILPLGLSGLDELSVGATFKLEILPEVDHLKVENYS